MGGRSSQQRLILFLFSLAFILLRAFVALFFDVFQANAGQNCTPFPQSVYTQSGVRSVGQVVCKAPDGKFATLGYESDSYIILDMGTGNEISDQSGIDLLFYSEPNEDGSLSPVV